MVQALITGATSGIGEALVPLLAEKGYDLILTGRNLTKLQQLAASLKNKTQILSLDLSDKKARSELISLLHAQAPKLIINSAGSGLYGDSLSLSTAEQLDMIALNIDALVEISLEGAKALIAHKKKGTILNVSSAASYFAYPLFNTYSASKGFVRQFSCALDAELREKGVRVLVSCPGQVDTQFRARSSKGISKGKSHLSMPTTFAAAEIWKQIETGKGVHIFDWRTRLLVFISRLVPRPFLEKYLKASMKDRIKD